MTDKESIPAHVSAMMETIAQVVADGGGGEAARQALIDAKNAQKAESVMSSEHVSNEANIEAMTSGLKKVTRPNGTDYYVRNIGKHEDIMMLRAARENSLPFMAYGPPGTGKTALIEAAFCDPEYTPKDGTNKVYTVQGTGDTETADFIGGFVPLGADSFEWNDGPLVRAMEEGAPLYIDEIALIDPKVMAVVYSVMDGRGELAITQNPERGIVKAAPGFYIASACNPNAPGARLSEAILSRFVLQFEVTTDYALAKSLGVPAKMVSAAQNLDKKLQAGEVGWAPQLRELLAFKAIGDVMGEDVALCNVISSSPEMDRVEVQSVLSRVYGRPIEELRVV